MEVTESIVINASPAAIFAIYADVERWPAWDPDTRAARIDGPFVTGATGRLTPAKGFPVPMRFTSVERDRGFTVVAPVMLSTMVFEHAIRPEGAGVRVVHGVAFHGPFAWFLRRLVGSRVRTGLPATMRRLKEHAERLQAAESDALSSY